MALNSWSFGICLPDARIAGVCWDQIQGLMHSRQRQYHPTYQNPTLKKKSYFKKHFLSLNIVILMFKMNIVLVNSL